MKLTGSVMKKDQDTLTGKLLKECLLYFKICKFGGGGGGPFFKQQIVRYSTSQENDGFQKKRKDLASFAAHIAKIDRRITVAWKRSPSWKPALFYVYCPTEKKKGILYNPSCVLILNLHIQAKALSCLSVCCRVTWGYKLNKPFPQTWPWYNRNGWLGVKHQVTCLLPTDNGLRHKSHTANSTPPLWPHVPRR